MNESAPAPTVPSKPSDTSAPKVTVPMNQNSAGNKSGHQSIQKQIIFVFIIATLGVFAAFGTFFIMNRFSTNELSQVDETLAWRPTLSGSCTSGNISLGPEPAEFDVRLDVTKNGQTQTLNFSSGADKQLDEDFQWPFTVANGDVIAWRVEVTWNNGEETHQGQVTISGCASASPSPSSTTYVEPDFPACPAGAQRLTISGEVANSSTARSKSHTLTTQAAGKISKIVGVKKEGHPEEGCKAGTGNDAGKNPCDQEQPNEGFTIKVNGAAYATVNDEGAGKDDQWFSFDITKDANLVNGNNTIAIEHIGGNGIGSVDYKASICYTTVQATATATASATATATARPSGSAPVGGVDPTPTPTPTRTATPTPVPTTQTTLPPAPSGDGQSDGQGCAQNDCSGNQRNAAEDKKAVANAGTAKETLPDAGIPNGVVMLVIGGVFTLVGLLLGRKKSFK